MHASSVGLMICSDVPQHALLPPCRCMDGSRAALQTAALIDTRITFTTLDYPHLLDASFILCKTLSFFHVDELRSQITNVMRYDNHDAIDCTTKPRINNRFSINILQQQISGSILWLTHQLLILRLSDMGGGHHLIAVINALFLRRDGIKSCSTTGLVDLSCPLHYGGCNTSRFSI